MYFIDAEKQYDDSYNYYCINVDEEGRILEKALLPKHVSKIAKYVSHDAILKCYLEGGTEVKFKVENGQLKSKRTSLSLEGIEVDLGEGQSVTIDRDDIGMSIGLMRDIESILQYNEELKEKA